MRLVSFKTEFFFLSSLGLGVRNKKESGLKLKCIISKLEVHHNYL